MQFKPLDWYSLESSSGVEPGVLRELAGLRVQYQLDHRTAHLLLGYLQKIAQLESQVRWLQSHVPHPSCLPREGPAPWREPHA